MELKTLNTLQMASLDVIDKKTSHTNKMTALGM
jgi:hypothetical protein